MDCKQHFEDVVAFLNSNSDKLLDENYRDFIRLCFGEQLHDLDNLEEAIGVMEREENMLKYTDLTPSLMLMYLNKVPNIDYYQLTNTEIERQIHNSYVLYKSFLILIHEEEEFTEFLIRLNISSIMYLLPEDLKDIYFFYTKYHSTPDKMLPLICVGHGEVSYHSVCIVPKGISVSFIGLNGFPTRLIRGVSEHTTLYSKSSRWSNDNLYPVLWKDARYYPEGSVIPFTKLQTTGSFVGGGVWFISGAVRLNNIYKSAKVELQEASVRNYSEAIEKNFPRKYSVVQEDIIDVCQDLFDCDVDIYFAACRVDSEANGYTSDKAKLRIDVHKEEYIKAMTKIAEGNQLLNFISPQVGGVIRRNNRRVSFSETSGKRAVRDFNIYNLVNRLRNGHVAVPPLKRNYSIDEFGVLCSELLRLARRNYRILSLRTAVEDLVLSLVY